MEQEITKSLDTRSYKSKQYWFNGMGIMQYKHAYASTLKLLTLTSQNESKDQEVGLKQ